MRIMSEFLLTYSDIIMLAKYSPEGSQDINHTRCHILKLGMKHDKDNNQLMILIEEQTHPDITS